jgi:hypothetical protein
VVWVHPETQSLDDPPTKAGLKLLPDARATVNRIPEMGGALDRPIDPGHFSFVASCEWGRFEGTVVSMLPIPAPDEDLPDTFTLTGVTGPPECN